jgi:hypothetical protein
MAFLEPPCHENMKMPINIFCSIRKQNYNEKCPATLFSAALREGGGGVGRVGSVEPMCLHYLL